MSLFSPLQQLWRRYFKNKQTMMDFMQANMLMYFLEKHDYKLSAEPIAEIDQKLLPIAKKLQSANLIAPSDIEGTFVISEEGKQAIGRTIAETESYIDQYDVFKDVYYDQGLPNRPWTWVTRSSSEIWNHKSR